MKLSERTLQVLKNFSTINPTIFIRAGNEIRTIAPTKSMFAQATVPESFPKDFAIYELSRFLGVISLFTDPDFDFQDKYVTVSSGKQRVNYTYANPEMVDSPSKKTNNFPDPVATFTLTSESLSAISKAGAILQMPDVAITGADGVITISAINSKESTSDTFKLEVGETNEDFQVILKPENLKLIPAEYQVSITTAGICWFETSDLTYWIACLSK